MDKWQQYEQEKSMLIWEDLSPQEYSDRIREIVKRLGL